MSDFASKSTAIQARAVLNFILTLAAILYADCTAIAQTPALTVQFSSGGYNVNEGTGSTTITVTLSTTSTQTVTVNYATSDGTATAPGDYTSTSGTLSFAPGDTSKTFSVAIINDSSVEPEEEINLTLSNPVNATLGTASTAFLNILDDDIPPPIVQFGVASYTVVENAGTAIITVSLFGTSTQTVTVNYATSDGTAAAPGDYTSTSGTLSFAPGDTSKTFSVAIINDSSVELDETITLTLSNVQNATLGTNNTVALCIIDDDRATTYSVPVSVVAESLGAMGVSEEKETAITAEASLVIDGVPPSGSITGPLWTWQVISVQFSSDGTSFSSSTGGDHVQLIHPDSTSADATVITSFDTAGYWNITIRATATYYNGATQLASGNADYVIRAMVAATFDFDKGTPLALHSVVATANKQMEGTSPPDGAFVSAGQNILFQITLKDMDQFRKTGDPNWTLVGSDPGQPGQYSLVLKLTNAKFTGTNLTEGTLVLGRLEGGINKATILAASNIKITVDAPWAGDVKLDITVTDGVTIPNTVPLGPGGKVTDIQDPKFTTTLTWKKATVFPTTQTPFKQDPGKLGENQATDALTVWYIYGLDLNGANNAAPNYQGITVNEKFTARTSNLQTAWVSNNLRMMQPNWGDAQWVQFFFSDPFMEITFMIGADDCTSDTHTFKPFGTNPNALSAAGLAATIFVDIPQTHEVPEGKTLGKYTIRHQRVGAANGNPTFWIQKK